MEVYVIECRPKTPEGEWYPVEFFRTQDAANHMCEEWNEVPPEAYEYRVAPYVRKVDLISTALSGKEA